MNNAPMNNAPMNQAIVSDATSNAAPVAPAAVGPSAGPALPEMGSKMPYIVQRGDTLAKIATKVYGSSDKWKDISNLSGLANPSRIYPGDVVYYTLDDKSQAFATAYESVQRGSTQVQQGDTLATIAQRVYGSSGSWKSIWRQNDNINNPDKLDPGMTVYYIQAGALSAAVKEVRAKLNNVAQNIKKC
jgi:nucleoid-associated protein YgaU